MFFVPLLISAAVAAHAAQPTAAIADNPRLTAIYDADQGDRAPGDKIDWNKVWPADDARRAAVRRMLDAGEVRTGADYQHAAFVFQHGDEPRDYLLAHALAVTAVAKGKAEAGWIAAATLDRYLGAVGQPQIYGTQYRWKPGRPASQEPYDRTLIGDDQRRAIGVPVLAEQDKRRRDMDAERSVPSVAPRR